MLLGLTKCEFMKSFQPEINYTLLKLLCSLLGLKQIAFSLLGYSRYFFEKRNLSFQQQEGNAVHGPSKHH